MKLKFYDDDEFAYEELAYRKGGKSPRRLLSEKKKVRQSARQKSSDKWTWDDWNTADRSGGFAGRAAAGPRESRH